MTKKSKIPCIKDKCILLPVCKSKTYIVCDTLFNYYDTKYKKIRNVNITFNNYKDVYISINNLNLELRTYFPNITSLWEGDHLILTNKSYIIKLRK